MSGYGIDDVPHVELGEADLVALADADAAQVALMAEAVIRVAEDDTVLGPVSKVESHRGPGSFHRAFSLLLFNTKGEMLLQQRSAE